MSTSAPFVVHEEPANATVSHRSASRDKRRKRLAAPANGEAGKTRSALKKRRVLLDPVAQMSLLQMSLSQVSSSQLPCQKTSWLPNDNLQAQQIAYKELQMGYDANANYLLETWLVTLSNDVLQQQLNALRTDNHRFRLHLEALSQVKHPKEVLLDPLGCRAPFSPAGAPSASASGVPDDAARAADKKSGCPPEHAAGYPPVRTESFASPNESAPMVAPFASLVTKTVGVSAGIPIDEGAADKGNCPRPRKTRTDKFACNDLGTTPSFDKVYRTPDDTAKRSGTLLRFAPLQGAPRTDCTDSARLDSDARSFAGMFDAEPPSTAFLVDPLYGASAGLQGGLDAYLPSGGFSRADERNNNPYASFDLSAWQGDAKPRSSGASKRTTWSGVPRDSDFPDSVLFEGSSTLRGEAVCASPFFSLPELAGRSSPLQSLSSMSSHSSMDSLPFQNNLLDDFPDRELLACASFSDDFWLTDVPHGLFDQPKDEGSPDDSCGLGQMSFGFQDCLYGSPLLMACDNFPISSYGF